MMDTVYNKVKDVLRDIKYYLCFLLWELKLLRHKEKEKTFVFCAPDHGNLGDHAITEGEKTFFRVFLNREIVEVPSSFSNRKAIYNRIVKKYIDKTSLIVINGGGFLGDVWTGEYDVVEKMVKNFKNKKIVILPQSVFFKDKDNQKKSSKIFAAHPDLTIFVRESFSYKIAKKIYPKNEVLFAPDMAFLMDLGGCVEFRKQHRVLFLMRDDAEKAVTRNDEEGMKRLVEMSGYEVTVADTVMDRRISPERRTRYLKRIRKTIESCDFVVTDRLHGMIFSVIFGTKCIVVKNDNLKIIGVYNWIKDKYNVRMIDSIDDFRGALFEMKKDKLREFSRKKNEKEYSALVRCFKDWYKDEKQC